MPCLSPPSESKPGSSRSEEEKTELVANCDRFSRLKHSTAFPLVFTEHGAIMAANVLNSQRTVEASVQVVRALMEPPKTPRRRIGFYADWDP